MRPLKVVCPGAIRPLKNQFVQAVAAIRYAESQGRNLDFYINTTRSEQGGDALYRNITQLFKDSPHELHGIPWLEHDKFIEFLRSMDIGLQCSFTESFNICAADIVSVGVPLVASPEIDWTTTRCQADPTSTSDIAEKMEIVINSAEVINKLNLSGLMQRSEQTERIWLETI